MNERIKSKKETPKDKKREKDKIKRENRMNKKGKNDGTE